MKRLALFVYFLCAFPAVSVSDDIKLSFQSKTKILSSVTCQQSFCKFDNNKVILDGIVIYKEDESEDYTITYDKKINLKNEEVIIITNTFNYRTVSEIKSFFLSVKEEDYKIIEVDSSNCREGIDPESVQVVGDSSFNFKCKSWDQSSDSKGIYNARQSVVAEKPVKISYRTFANGVPNGYYLIIADRCMAGGGPGKSCFFTQNREFTILKDAGYSVWWGRVDDVKNITACDDTTGRLIIGPFETIKEVKIIEDKLVVILKDSCISNFEIIAVGIKNEDNLEIKAFAECCECKCNLNWFNSNKPKIIKYHNKLRDDLLKRINNNQSNYNELIKLNETIIKNNKYENLNIQYWEKRLAEAKKKYKDITGSLPELNNCVWPSPSPCESCEPFKCSGPSIFGMPPSGLIIGPSGD